MALQDLLKQKKQELWDRMDAMLMIADKNKLPYPTKDQLREMGYITDDTTSFQGMVLQAKFLGLMVQSGFLLDHKDVTQQMYQQYLQDTADYIDEHYPEEAQMIEELFTDTKK